MNDLQAGIMAGRQVRLRRIVIGIMLLIASVCSSLGAAMYIDQPISAYNFVWFAWLSISTIGSSIGSGTMFFLAMMGDSK